MILSLFALGLTPSHTSATTQASTQLPRALSAAQPATRPAARPAAQSAAQSAAQPVAQSAAQPVALPAPAPTPTPEPSPLSPAQRQSDRLTWGVAPSTPDGPTDRGVFDYQMNPGDGVMDYLAVANYSTQDLELDIYARDAVITQDGGFDIQPKSEAPTDAGAWFELSTNRVTVPARSRANISFWFRVPPNAEPGDHAAGLVASLPADNKAASTTTIGLEQRVGMRMYVQVSGALRPALEAEFVETEFDARNVGLSGTIGTVLRVTNTGNVRLAGEARVEANDWWDLTQGSSDTVEVPELLPGDSLDFELATTQVGAFGKVQARGIVQPIARDELGLTDLDATTVTTTLWAIPWLVIAVIVLLIAVAILWLGRRRRKRTALRRARPADQPAQDGHKDKQVDDAAATSTDQPSAPSVPDSAADPLARPAKHAATVKVA
ncbi:MAG: DUF916 domain-containing protein [Bifidobacteriaceae bacterium]|nr:DUF916 domain-containing protein [Bifidobacteriaceae bacterium]